VKGQSEQSLLVGGVSYPIRDIEEGDRPQTVTVDDPNPARLLDDEQPPAAVAGGTHGDGPFKSGQDEL
jgi:hypothetical protein